MTYPAIPANSETAELVRLEEAADLRAPVKRRAAADAVRRCRARKRGGKLLAPVALPPLSDSKKAPPADGASPVGTKSAVATIPPNRMIHLSGVGRKRSATLRLWLALGFV